MDCLIPIGVIIVNIGIWVTQENNFKPLALMKWNGKAPITGGNRAIFASSF
jgi:hypothetical protein